MIREGKKLLKYFSGISFGFKFLWKDKKGFYFLSVLEMILGTVNAFAIVLFTKYLWAGLEEKDYEAVIATVLLFVSWQFLFSVANNWMKQKKGIYSLENKRNLKLLMMDKVSTLRYEQMQDTEILKQYDFALKCIETGNVESCIQSTFSIFSSAVIIGGMFFVLNGLPFWVWLIIIMVVVTNVVGHILDAKHTYHETQEETVTERSLYYLRGRLMNKEYGKEIRSFQLSEYILGKTIGIIEEFFQMCQHYDRKHNKIHWWLDIAEGVQIFVLYFYNVVLFFSHSITVDIFMMNISALFQFTNAVNTIFTQLVHVAEQSVYLYEYSSFLVVPSTYDGQEPVAFEEDYTIEFVDVSFRYPGEKQYALKHVNLTIHSQEKISVVGANGAGKTTFVKLLLGLYRPENGTILFNKIDIEKLKPQEYMRLFSTVMQDYQLYSFKILDNILFDENDTEETRSRALDALKKMGLDKVLEQFSDGEDSYLTQRYSDTGIELSGGEHQKLAVARALYKNAPIMILDEPTSALSPQSEYEIYRIFSQITESKTVIYISHRMSSCTLCDRVLVFEKGKIVEDGSHVQLMKQKGLYAQMFQSQASFYEI